MTVRRVDDVIMLEDSCLVDDAEILMQELQSGASLIDWTACTHVHTACLQVMMAARLPVRGIPANPALARWIAPTLGIAPLLDPLTASGGPASGDATQTARLMEA